MDEAIAQLQTLYESHGPALLAYLRRRAGGAQVADDLLHETFVQALRRRHRMGDVVTPRAWLFTIARRVAVSNFRWRRRRPSAGLPTEVAADASTQEDPRLAGVREAIAALPEPLRETLELRVRHDLSYQEIAEVLAIPVGTVRSRLHRAVRRLRETLTANEV